MAAVSPGKILVTGGAGFIGSHLVDALLAAGFSVRVVDDFSTGSLTNLPGDHPDLEVVEADVAHAQVAEQAVAGVAAVVHLAAVASVQASVENPAVTHSANFISTLHLLEACRRHGVSRFIYASSAAVYGNGAPLPISEEAAVQPLTPYAVDKLTSEYYLDFYGRQYGLEPGIFRFFNVFGPRQDPSSPYSGVISIFVDRALAHGPLTIYGDGRQSRDFIYVADLVGILVKAITAPALAAGPVNVGTGSCITLLELLEQLQELLGYKLEVHHEEARQGDVKHSRADISRLEKRFAFEPKYTFAAGLQHLVKHVVAGGNV